MAGKGRPRNPIRPDTLAGRIGERIEALRKRRGLTSAQLAEAAGVGLATIIAIEGGRSMPKVDTVTAIAGGLGMTGDKLLKGIKGWA